jgi:hypothetical protein
LKLPRIRVEVKGWIPLLLSILFVACLIGLGIWLFHSVQLVELSHRVDSTITSAESRGMKRLLMSLAATSIVFVAIALSIAFINLDVFGSSKKPELYWLYVTFAVLIASLFFQFGGVFLFPRVNPGIDYAHHPVYFLALARTCLVTILLILGTAMYIVKLNSKLLYGVAEITAAVITNAAVIAPIDLSRFPRTHFKPDEIFALGALAYLFSKGIGDAIDGVSDIRKRRTNPGEAV